MERLTAQILRKDCPDNYQVAEHYFSLLSSINSLCLSPREIQLLAFSATRGSISFAGAREEFCRRFSTTNPMVYNLVSKLKKTGLLIKEKNRVIVHPALSLDFNKDIVLQIRLSHGTEAA